MNEDIIVVRMQPGAGDGKCRSCGICPAGIAFHFELEDRAVTALTKTEDGEEERGSERRRSTFAVFLFRHPHHDRMRTVARRRLCRRPRTTPITAARSSRPRQSSLPSHVKRGCAGARGAHTCARSRESLRTETAAVFCSILVYRLRLGRGRERNCLLACLQALCMERWRGVRAV